MPEQVCSGIFYNRRFLKQSASWKFYIIAEATNPQAEVRENATHDIKGGIKDGGGIEKTKTALPDTPLPYITLLRTSYYSTFHRLTWHCATLHRPALHRPTSHCPTYSSWRCSVWRYIAWDHATRHFLDDIILSCIVGRKNYVIFVPAELRSIREQPKQFHYFLPLHPFVCISFVLLPSVAITSLFLKTSSL